uniref:(northern house mosquito) hypothetical protein n=1 Tax=Culex pipiens TaxID=7175 RepID=A0A8D8KZ41_CULPI
MTQQLHKPEFCSNQAQVSADSSFQITHSPTQFVYTSTSITSGFVFFSFFITSTKNRTFLAPRFFSGPAKKHYRKPHTALFRQLFSGIYEKTHPHTARQSQHDLET